MAAAVARDVRVSPAGMFSCTAGPSGGPSGWDIMAGVVAVVQLFVLVYGRHRAGFIIGIVVTAVSGTRGNWVQGRLQAVPVRARTRLF
jgi:hypothetical protein